MTDFKSTFESSLDLTKPREFPADISDSIEPSNLIPYQPSDTKWLTKDPFEVLPWDFVGADQTFNPFAEGAGLAEVELRSLYAASNHGAPAGWGGYTIKTDDTLSWSPSHSNDNKGGSLSSVFTSTSSQKSENTTNINPRKASDAFSSSSTSSPYSPLTLPKSTVSSTTSIPKSPQSILAKDTDTAAVVKRKRVAHNAIEKRYRANMNIKFLALGNAIPR